MRGSKRLLADVRARSPSCRKIHRRYEGEHELRSKARSRTISVLRRNAADDFRSGSAGTVTVLRRWEGAFAHFANKAGRRDRRFLPQMRIRLGEALLERFAESEYVVHH